MIQEAYCSYEIAKLLKEKGFDERTLYHYTNCDVLQHNIVYNEYKNSEMLNAYSAPTHQMACAWLREVHKIAINIRIVCKKTISYAFDIWDFNIIHPNEFVGGTIDLVEQQFDFKSYEEAVEAALKYYLETFL